MPKKSGKSLGWNRPPFDFDVGHFRFCLGFETKIMGVLNVTPDSFSDGGIYSDPGLAEERALKMEREGAHIIDIGGESTRPGALPVSVKEEIRRTRPVIRRLARKLKIPLSVDTYKYEVAAAALDEGALMVNDVRALSDNKRLAKLIARTRAAVVLMHMQGVPQTMQTNPLYKNLFKEITSFLKKAVDGALEAGISRSSIVIDPGFGFGKTPEHNIEILSLLYRFSKLEYPLLAGLSRKSFIGNITEAAAQDRLYGSLAAAACAVYQGAHILRVHDVMPHVQLCKVIDKTLKRKCAPHAVNHTH